MAAMELLSHLFGIDLSNLSKTELFLLETDLLMHICEELKEIFRKHYKDYFYLMKFTKNREDIMIENNLVRLIIKDILATEEYDLSGIARYTDTHKDVVQEVYDGRNIDPSSRLLRRIIELHRSVRRDLYLAIIKRIAAKYLAVT